ncbi:MAG: hypothetical protein ACLU4B_04785 [Bilophila wadsworthia]
MKKMLIAAVCLMLLSPAHAGASLFGSDGPKDTDEITPLQYASLLGLRDIDPVMFRTKLMPLIDEAMKDGKITVGECKEIEKAAGNVAPAFTRRGSPAPSGQHLGNDGQGEEGRQRNWVELEDTLNNQLPQLFDDAMNLFRDQMRQYNKEKPEAPTNL